MYTQLTQRCDSLPSFCLKPRRGSSWSKVSPRLDKPYTCVMKKTVYLAVFGGPRSQVFNTLSQSLEVTCNIAATEGTAVAVEDSISSDMIHCQLCNPAMTKRNHSRAVTILHTKLLRGGRGLVGVHQ